MFRRKEITLCSCERYPVAHHAEWCAMPATPTTADWYTFEVVTLRDWAGRC